MSEVNRSVNWSHCLSELEAFLLARKPAQVFLGIKKLLTQKSPRETLAPMAALARRAGYPYLALRILQPLFRQEGRIRESPTSYESFVYGSALIVVGAKTEGLKLFQTIDPESQPEVLLFRANSFITEWRYQEAQTILEEYLSKFDLKPLQRLVGNLNLCSSYIVLKKPQKFRRLIQESYRLAAETKATHLNLSVVELEAQFYYSQNNLIQAQQIIKQTFPQGIKVPTTIFEALLRKWDLLSLAKLSRHPEERMQIVAALGDLAHQCQQRQFWEVHRDCDFQLGLLTGNKTPIYRAYFGSPYKEYRKILLAQVKGKVDIPSSWISSETDSSESVLQRATGKLGDKVIFEPFRKPWNLLFLLSQDLYRPLSLGRLFNDLFPDEYFVKSLAAHRIQGLIGELRSLFLTHGLEAEIQVQRNSYQLLLRQPVEYNRADVLFRSHKNYLIHSLCERKDEQYLSAKQIQQEYQISRTLVLEVLKAMETALLIQKIPRGRETIYRFIKSGKAVA